MAIALKVADMGVSVSVRDLEGGEQLLQFTMPVLSPDDIVPLMESDFWLPTMTTKQRIGATYLN